MILCVSVVYRNYDFYLGFPRFAGVSVYSDTFVGHRKENRLLYDFVFFTISRASLDSPNDDQNTILMRRTVPYTVGYRLTAFMHSSMVENAVFHAGP